MIIKRIDFLFIFLTIVVAVACNGNTSKEESPQTTELDSSSVVEDISESPSNSNEGVEEVLDDDKQLETRKMLFQELVKLAQEANNIYASGDYNSWQEISSEIENKQIQVSEFDEEYEPLTYEELGYLSDKDMNVDYYNFILWASTSLYEQYKYENALEFLNILNTNFLTLEQKVVFINLQLLIHRDLGDWEEADEIFNSSLIFTEEEELEITELMSSNLQSLLAIISITMLDEPFSIDNDPEPLAELIEMTPSFPAAYYWQGRLLYENENWEEATNNFNKALDLNANYAEAYYWRGRTLLWSNKLSSDEELYLEAAEDFETARKINPRYIDAYLSLAAASALLNEKEIETELLSMESYLILAALVDPDMELADDWYLVDPTLTAGIGFLQATGQLIESIPNNVANNLADAIAEQEENNAEQERNYSTFNSRNYTTDQVENCETLSIAWESGACMTTNDIGMMYQWQSQSNPSYGQP